MPTASEDKGEHDSRIIQKMSNLWHNIQHWSLNAKTHENSYRKIMLQLSNVRYKIQENNLSINAHEDSPKE